jgi:ribosomal protein L16 Arg81 hydroxylase
VIEFGLTPADFRDAYFEQKPLHMPGALRERPFDWTSLNELLHGLDPTVPTIRMFHHGQVPEHAYTQEFVEVGKTRRKLDKPKFYEYMRNGATLQFNWLERHSVAAKRLCREVGRFAGTQTSANAYLSFSGDGTFGEHWDTHDVFAIQLIGRKRWRIFPPTFPLPLTYQTHDRGWWHHVIPLQVGSFHVSVGCYLPTMFDYIVQTAAKYLELHPGVRRGFSPTNYEETVEDALTKLRTVLLDPSNVAGFDRDWIGREHMNAEFNLASLDSAADPLPDSAVLSLATFRSRGLEGNVLPVNGGQLQMEPVSQAVVAALADCSALQVGELCARLGNVPPEAVRRAVLDLSRYDVVNIQR